MCKFRKIQAEFTQLSCFFFAPPCTYSFPHFIQIIALRPTEISMNCQNVIFWRPLPCNWYHLLATVLLVGIFYHKFWSKLAVFDTLWLFHSKFEKIETPVFLFRFFRPGITGCNLWRKFFEIEWLTRKHFIAAPDIKIHLKKLINILATLQVNISVISKCFEIFASLPVSSEWELLFHWKEILNMGSHWKGW